MLPKQVDHHMQKKKKRFKIKADFLSETMKARRQWHRLFKMLKKSNSQPRIVHSSQYFSKFKAKYIFRPIIFVRIQDGSYYK